MYRTRCFYRVVRNDFEECNIITRVIGRGEPWNPILKDMKILDFFLFLWVIFALLDPDPATQIDADPDPKPWIISLPTFRSSS